jgi:muramoyltetrapeptide carboxypeptidase LdcA involved in peptidoglycan recycling
MVPVMRLRTLIGPARMGRCLLCRRTALGLNVSFGDHAGECDDFSSSPVAARLAHLHAAFADPDVDEILT